MKRRGKGEGTIYKRSDGRWCAQVTVGWEVDEEGNLSPKRKTLYGTKRSEVKEKLTKALRDQDQGLPVGLDERMTLATYLDTWLEHGARPNISPTTYEQYEEICRLHLKPELGGLGLVRLTPTSVQAMINRKAATSLSPRRVQLIHSILRRALNQALRWELVTRNVATMVKPPKAKPFKPTVLDVDQAKALIKVAQKDRLGAVFTVAAAVGLRMGEALGLRWVDLELERGELQVVQTVKRYGGELHLGEPKTESSQRTVALPRAVVKALRRHRKLQAAERLAAGSRWVDRGLVFTTRRGGPLDARNVARSMRRLCTTAGVPVVRFHDLRHTAATLLLVQGVDARTIMEVLGHTRISTTMDIYAHVMPELKREAAAAMDELLDE